jgi:hypothetical protein
MGWPKADGTASEWGWSGAVRRVPRLRPWGYPGESGLCRLVVGQNLIELFGHFEILLSRRHVLSSTQ